MDNFNNIYVRVNDRNYTTKNDELKMLCHKVLKTISIEESIYGTIITLPSNYSKNKSKIKKQIQAFFNKYENKNIVYSNEIDEDLKWKNGLTNINREVPNETNVSASYEIYL